MEDSQTYYFFWKTTKQPHISEPEEQQLLHETFPLKKKLNNKSGNYL